MPAISGPSSATNQRPGSKSGPWHLRPQARERAQPAEVLGERLAHRLVEGAEIPVRVEAAHGDPGRPARAGPASRSSIAMR